MPGKWPCWPVLVLIPSHQSPFERSVISITSPDCMDRSPDCCAAKSYKARHRCVRGENAVERRSSSVRRVGGVCIAMTGTPPRTAEGFTIRGGAVCWSGEGCDEERDREWVCVDNPFLPARGRWGVVWSALDVVNEVLNGRKKGAVCLPVSGPKGGLCFIWSSWWRLSNSSKAM